LTISIECFILYLEEGVTMTNKINLDDLTMEDLENELVRRKKELAKRPEALLKPDYSAISRYAESIINTIAKEGYPPKDHKHYCYEIVMETVYGRQVWEWLNKHDKS
jgi:hypothetical protein